MRTNLKRWFEKGEMFYSLGIFGRKKTILPVLFQIHT